MSPFVSSAGSLQRLLFCSFVPPAILITLLVVTAATLYAIAARDSISGTASNTLIRPAVYAQFADVTQHHAQAISIWMYSIEGSVELMNQVIRDRIVGYTSSPSPTANASSSGWDWMDDRYVPFVDQSTSTTGKQKQNQYPLAMKPLPMMEYKQETEVLRDMRKQYFSKDSPTTTTVPAPQSAFFVSSAVKDVYEEAMAAPHVDGNETSTTKSTTLSILHGIHQRSGDLAVLLQPIVEASPAVQRAFLDFVTHGVGSTLTVYSSSTIQEELKEQPPKEEKIENRFSAGTCQWLQKTVNRQTQRPYMVKNKDEDDDGLLCFFANETSSPYDYSPPMDEPYFRQCVEHSPNNHATEDFKSQFAWIPTGSNKKNKSINPETVQVCSNVFDAR